MYPTRTAARSALAGTGLAAALVAPGALAAQRSPVPSGVGGEVYVAHNTSFPEPRMLAGAALTAGSGFLVLRGSGAMNRVTDDVGGATETPWTLDGDVMLNSGALGQMAGILLGGFAPVGFVGVGKQGIYRADGESPSMANLSWGGGASISLFEGLRINAEARWRTTLSRDQLLPEGFGPGREIKAGLSFGFGAGSGSRGGASRAPGRTSGGSSGGRTGGVSYPSVPASASARRVLDTADDYVGVPYVWGGETPRGFDCSGFVQYVYARNGVRLPRTSRQQSVVGDYVSPDAWALRPGDLMFFATHGGTTVDHVAMYAGNGRMIHSSSSGNGVAFDDLSSDRGQWFVGRMVAARRMITDGTGLVRSLEAALRMREQLDPPDMAPRRRNR
ncbi:MAG: C40 family peptidase [Gemmatimonadaceae bacterium]